MPTPSLAARITPAKIIESIPLYRRDPQFERTVMALRLIRIGGTFIVPLIHLLNEVLSPSR
jgi:hypothetical protein